MTDTTSEQPRTGLDDLSGAVATELQRAGAVLFLRDDRVSQALAHLMYEAATVTKTYYPGPHPRAPRWLDLAIGVARAINHIEANS
jgi:hypothetical protein